MGVDKRIMLGRPLFIKCIMLAWMFMIWTISGGLCGAHSFLYEHQVRFIEYLFMYVSESIV